MWGNMRYSILTPTLCRPTLKRLCDSIDFQTNQSWEHIIVVDKSINALSLEERNLISDIQANEKCVSGQRKFKFCSKSHPMDFGNAARREAYDIAQGDYICQIDDDDYYADKDVLKTLEKVTKAWAIYPVLARNTRCHRNPPGIGLTGSAMFLYRRDTGIKFPDNDHYAADGEVVELLKKKYPYQSLDDERELVIYPWANHGMTQTEIDRRMSIRRGPIKYKADGLTIDWNDQKLP
jgi:glycosyltransferase involved in cell wall biosynthesis